MCVYVTAPILAAFYGAMTIVQFYYVTPKAGQTQWTHLFTSDAFVPLQKTYLPISSVGLGFDLFLLVLPIQAILKLQLARRMKLGLLAVFGTGFL